MIMPQRRVQMKVMAFKFHIQSRILEFNFPEIKLLIFSVQLNLFQMMTTAAIVS